jgi:hypothetical protein
MELEYSYNTIQIKINEQNQFQIKLIDSQNTTNFKEIISTSFYIIIS